MTESQISKLRPSQRIVERKKIAVTNSIRKAYNLAPVEAFAE